MEDMITEALTSTFGGILPPSASNIQFPLYSLPEKLRDGCFAQNKEFSEFVSSPLLHNFNEEEEDDHDFWIHLMEEWNHPFSGQIVNRFISSSKSEQQQQSKNKFGMLIERGSCSFYEKALLAQTLGASFLVIGSSSSSQPLTRPGLTSHERSFIGIPSFLISHSSYESLLEEMNINEYSSSKEEVESTFDLVEDNLSPFDQKMLSFVTNIQNFHPIEYDLENDPESKHSCSLSWLELGYETVYEPKVLSSLKESPSIDEFMTKEFDGDVTQFIQAIKQAISSSKFQFKMLKRDYKSSLERAEFLKAKEKEILGELGDILEQLESKKEDL